MNKGNIKNELLNHQEAVVADLEKMISQLKNSADIDEEGGVKDIDDLARADVDFEMKQNIELTHQQAVNDLELLKRLPTEQQTEVAPGAVVETDSKLFYVAIPSVGFDVEGNHFVGISTIAPIYAAMKGKKAGDTFGLGKNQYQIKNIF